MAALLLALAQPAAAEAVPVCSLVTPGGNAIGFFVGGDDAPDKIRLSATSGSIWPQATLRASRLSSGRFAIGAERRGLALELGSLPAGQTQRSATLLLRDGERTSLPVAFGYCEDRPVDATAAAPSADPRAVGADNAAFNPARWPQYDCALLLSNSRSLRFRFTLTERNDLRLESRELWSGRPVSTTIRWAESPNSVQLGAFGSEGGPEGLQMMFVDDRSRGVKLFRFRKLGDPSLPNVSGYGICGFTGLVRRPVME
jgi:hypothetical protein